MNCQEIIQESNSPYLSPAICVDKRDEEKASRLVVDLRKLNTNTVAEIFPFQRIDDLIDGKYYHTKFNLKS